MCSNSVFHGGMLRAPGPWIFQQANACAKQFADGRFGSPPEMVPEMVAGQMSSSSPVYPKNNPVHIYLIHPVTSFFNSFRCPVLPCTSGQPFHLQGRS